MSPFFAFLMLVFLALLVISLVKPSFVLRWGDESKRTRKRALLYFGGAAVVCLALSIATMTPEQKEAARQARIEQQQKEQQEAERIAEEKAAEEKAAAERAEAEKARQEEVQQQEAQPAASEPEETKLNEGINMHMHDVFDALQAHGYQNIDFSMMEYAQAEITKGIIICRTTFKAGQQQHRVEARYGRNSKELVYLSVDGHELVSDGQKFMEFQRKYKDAAPLEK